MALEVATRELKSVNTCVKLCPVRKLRPRDMNDSAHEFEQSQLKMQIMQSNICSAQTNCTNGGEVSRQRGIDRNLSRNGARLCTPFTFSNAEL